MSSEEQRAELHRTIWKIANELRGSIDGWDFKSYVLGMLFYRFISENLTLYIDANQHRAGEKDFSYVDLADEKAEFGRKVTVEQKGFFMLPSELFENVLKACRSDSNLNETLDRIFDNIEKSAVGSPSEEDLKGLFEDLDVNSNKLGATVVKRNELLVKLLESIGQLDFGAFKDNKIDAFGDAYEYLMSMYASNAGKSGGEFFTPQEVSELLARITLIGKESVNKVYDPACGSGSLLLQYAKVLGRDNIREGFFGQEINLTTYNLCRINMFLHDINYEKFNIAHGDTLTDPKHLNDEPFEAIVSNPPYSINWDGDANPLLINDERYAPAGALAPKNFADMAFTMHILHSLAVNGTAAIVEFPGVMYRPGAEQKIRQYLVDGNFVDAVIQLPTDLFYGTTIGTCILVLKKSKTENSTLFVDASSLFTRAQTKNKLMPSHMTKILETVENRIAEEYFSAVIDNAEVASNEYDLTVSNYVSREDTREHVNITSLNSEIEEIVLRQMELRELVHEIVDRIESSR
jgi:type I restriction enzyme M protein